MVIVSRHPVRENVEVAMDTVNTQVAFIAVPEQEIAAPPIIVQRCPRKCGLCGLTGHDKRNCPNLANQASKNQNPLLRSNPAANITTTTQEISASVCWDSCYYVVFDIETTGFSRRRNEIIQIGAQILSSDGEHVENGSFCSLVKPTEYINDTISNLTGITNERVAGADNFETVGDNFLQFIRECCENEGEKDIIFVAHNGVRFDDPFLISKYSEIKVINRS